MSSIKMSEEDEAAFWEALKEQKLIDSQIEKTSDSGSVTTHLINWIEAYTVRKVREAVKEKIETQGDKVEVDIKVDGEIRRIKVGYYDAGSLRKELLIPGSRELYCEGTRDFLVDDSTGILRVSRDTVLYTGPKQVG